MMRLRTIIGVVALATAYGLTGAAVAGPLANGRNPQFAVTAPFIDVGGVAECADADSDNQCDRSVAFITKSGFWGVRIQGVELNGVGPLTVCLTGDHGALVLAEGITPRGPNKTISAGGDLFADTGLHVVGLPGFGIIAGNPPGECFGHLVEFETGLSID